MSTGEPRPRVVVVAGMARDRTIGLDGGIPWHYTEDMRHFKRATMGTALVLGRKTFDSFGGRPLPGRDNIVLTRDPAALAARAPDVFPCNSLDAALAIAAERGATTVCICGGADVYRRSLAVADELLLSFIPEDGGGDTFFPEWDDGTWVELSRVALGESGVEVVRYGRVGAPG